MAHFHKEILVRRHLEMQHLRALKADRNTQRIIKDVSSFGSHGEPFKPSPGEIPSKEDVAVHTEGTLHNPVIPEDIASQLLSGSIEFD